MPSVIAFEGRQTVANAEEAAARLRAALSGGDGVEIDLSGVTEADLAFVQVLLAARRSSGGTGARVRRGPSAALAQVIERGGLGAANLLETTKGDKP